MKKYILLSTVFVIQSSIAFAQSNPGEGFFEKYLPIAQLFDSPVFFACVMGSAALLLISTLIFLKYAKIEEKKAGDWAAGKSPETLVKLLDSPVPEESRRAYISLLKNSEEKEIDLLTKALEDQRRRGSINATLLFLLEELEAHKAIPLLQQIAKGKTQTASLAQRVVDNLLAIQENEKEEAEKKTKTAKSK